MTRTSSFARALACLSSLGPAALPIGAGAPGALRALEQALLPVQTCRFPLAPQCSTLHTLAFDPRPVAGFALGPALSQCSHQLQQSRGMFIQTQPTPNPHSLMFLPGQKVMESGSHEFSNARAGMASPLAKRLFAVDGVTAVFFGADFITITKQDDAGWAVLKPLVFSAIMDHYASGASLFSDAASMSRDDTAIHEDDDEVVAMIKELLETRIRPAVQEDGGDITYRSFDPDTGVVTVKMMGACSGCPSSSVTLKSGIENMLMHYIPEVKGVIEDAPEEHGGDDSSSKPAVVAAAEVVKENPLAAHLSN